MATSLPFYPAYVGFDVIGGESGVTNYYLLELINIINYNAPFDPDLLLTQPDLGLITNITL